MSKESVRRDETKKQIHLSRLELAGLVIWAFLMITISFIWGANGVDAEGMNNASVVEVEPNKNSDGNPSHESFNVQKAAETVVNNSGLNDGPLRTNARMLCDADLVMHGGFGLGFTQSIKSPVVMRTFENFCVLLYNDKRSFSVSLSESLIDFAALNDEPRMSLAIGALLDYLPR